MTMYAEVPCPVTGCSARFKVTYATPPGTWPCPCKHRDLQLTWAPTIPPHPNLEEVRG